MPTLEAALHTFLQEDRSPQTNRQYTYVLTTLVRSVGPGRSVHLITYEDLLDYIARLRHNRKPSTITGYIAIYKAFFAWCVDRRYTDTNPAAAIKRRVDRSRPQQPTSRAIPPDDLARMVDYARATSPRNYALLLFFIDTGCRVGGLVSLTLENLDLDGLTAYLVEKGGQWHKSLFGDETAAALRHWIQHRPPVAHNYVWTGRGPDYQPLKRTGVAAIIRRLAVETGSSRAWGPHAIRHAVGNAYAREGVPVTITQAKFGHSSPTITMQHYYPHDDTYLVHVSRQMSLAPLRGSDHPPETPQPRLLPRRKGAG